MKEEEEEGEEKSNINQKLICSKIKAKKKMKSNNEKVKAISKIKEVISVYG